MNRSVRIIVPLLAILLPLEAVSAASSAMKPAPGPGDFLYGLASGPAGSLEYLIAGRLAALASLGQEGGPHGESGPRIVPLVEDSGHQALADLLSQPSTDLAIVPAPLLDGAAREDSKLKDRVGYVAPLYLEAVHVLARADMGSVDALAGRRVAIDGPDGVGAALFASLGVAVAPVLTIPGDPGAAVRDGTLDAAVIVGGDPVALLAGMAPDAGLKLLAVPYSSVIDDGFVPATLRHADYPGLVPEGGTETVAAPAVLAVYLRAPRSERAQTLWSLVAGILNHADDPGLDAAGRALHEVNWAADLPGWRRPDPVARWLDARRRAAAAPSPLPTRKDQP